MIAPPINDILDRAKLTRVKLTGSVYVSKLLRSYSRVDVDAMVRSELVSELARAIADDKNLTIDKYVNHDVRNERHVAVLYVFTREELESLIKATSAETIDRAYPPLRYYGVVNYDK